MPSNICIDWTEANQAQKYIPNRPCMRLIKIQWHYAFKYLSLLLWSLSVDLESTISNIEKNVNFWNHQKHVQITCTHQETDKIAPGPVPGLRRHSRGEVDESAEQPLGHLGVGVGVWQHRARRVVAHSLLTQLNHHFRHQKAITVDTVSSFKVACYIVMLTREKSVRDCKCYFPHQSGASQQPAGRWCGLRSSLVSGTQPLSTVNHVGGHKPFLNLNQHKL